MSLDLRCLTVGPLQTNCYIIWDIDSRRAAIIDPGGDRSAIISTVESLGLSVERILLTHGHPDHAFLAGDLREHYGALIGMHEADILQLSEGLVIAEMFYDLNDYVPFEPDDLLIDGDTLMVGECAVRVLHTPGHSEGGLCFVTEAGAFCGDSIFAGSVGRTDFPGGHHSTLISSIKAKILTMNDSTILYPGHGPQTTVGAEKRSNPFIQ